ERDAQFARRTLGPHHLLPDGRVGRPAADGEVVSLDDRAAAVDPAPADEDVRGQEALDLAVVAVGRAAREAARLVEGAVVEEVRHPLADGQAAARALARDALLAAHLGGERLTAPQLLELGL